MSAAAAASPCHNFHPTSVGSNLFSCLAGVCCSPAVKLQPRWSSRRTRSAHRRAATGWLVQRGRCQPQSIALADILCLELLLTIPAQTCSVASGHCPVLALCSLTIAWPHWPWTVALTEGSGGLCWALPAAVPRLWRCRGPCRGWCILGTIWASWGNPDAGDAAVRVCQRSALCCNCLRSFMAPGKPKSTAGASR